jgi:DNA-binding response OmpR family regulator
MTRVLLVEDDPGISEPLARALRREGYDVDVREDGRAALEGARERPDLVVLDLGLPHLDGLEVCRRMRADGRTMPVLILTARADEVDTVVGLDAGADDYVTKPFRLAELLARVRALLRRTPDGNPVSDSEDIRIDPEGRRAWFRGEELQLTAKEFDLLRVLLREQGRVVTREQLMKEIWDTTWYGSTKTLDMHISVLRRKLGDDVAQPRYISTVRGLGFRFERPESVTEPS